MYENIRGYVLDEKGFRSANSGFARWGFARDPGGKTVFIKEFLSPVYPVETGVLPPHMIESKKALCEDYQISKDRLYRGINECNTGNIVRILDWFRWGAKYYIVTEIVHSDPLSIADIAAMTIEQKHLICKILIHCVNTLHSKNIVHSDIKHDNVLFKRTSTGKYVAKLIDFDGSFFEDSLPDPEEEFQGDMVYFAPESFLYIAEETDRINTKIDVYALGLLFHQYFTGSLPDYNKDEYNYPFEYVLDGNVLTSDPSIPEEYRRIIDSMLLIDADARPTLSQVFAMFRKIEEKNAGVHKEVPSAAPVPPTPQPVPEEKPIADSRVYAPGFEGFFYAGDL